MNRRTVLPSQALITGITLRTTVRRQDANAVKRIAASSRLFSSVEIDTAVGFVQECIHTGPTGGYSFVFAEREGEVFGYGCYGRVPLSLDSYDLHWIAVRRDAQGIGIGTLLLAASESAISVRGGRRVFVETSSRPPYRATRLFYERCGYRAEGMLREFCSPGDGKTIYVKSLSPWRVARPVISVTG